VDADRRVKGCVKLFQFSRLGQSILTAPVCLPSLPVAFDEFALRTLRHRIVHGSLGAQTVS
jgi:hypothetical protein